MNDAKLSQTELATELGLRPSTVKYYTQLALLPYEQAEAGLHRRYNLKAVTERLALINKLKDKGLNMNGIIRQLADEGKLYGEPDLYALNLNSKANNG